MIAPDANLKRAADDIVYGKLLNAGQTCIAPDYVLIRRSDRGRFVDLLRAAVEKRYPRAAANPDYTSIINDQQFARLTGYLNEAKSAGVDVVPLSSSETDEKSRRLAPCAVLDPPDSLRLMQDEIFGPILPIRSYDSLDQAIDYINAHPRPLAMYLFSASGSTIDSVLKRTVAGGRVAASTIRSSTSSPTDFHSEAQASAASASTTARPGSIPSQNSSRSSAVMESGLGPCCVLRTERSMS